MAAENASASSEAEYNLPSVEELHIDASPDAIPSPEEQFIQQYASGREAFLEREDSTRSDYSFRQSLTPMGKEACRIVDRIRKNEQKTLWTADADSGFYQGMPAVLSRKRAEESKLWRIAQRVPKGCLLHSHFDAMNDLSFLIEQAAVIPGMAFISSQPLESAEALDAAQIRFQFVGKDLVDANKDENLYSSSYKAETAVSVASAISTFKPTPKYRDFIHWLCCRHTINTDEALSPQIGTDAIWARFTSCFPLYNTLLTYEPIFRAALQRLFKELASDGIRWVEFRYCFLNPFYREGHTKADADFVHMYIAFDQELGKFQDTPEGQKFWGARFIWTGIRRFQQEDIQKSMINCIRHKAMFPHLIAAYDLVGHEDPGQPLSDLLPVIFWFRKAVAAAELTIPFVFHAGETIETGTDTTKNMYDAVLLGTRRMGHGYALYKHPLLLETVKSRNICIESCPLSNEILRMTSSVMAHPLPALLARGVKCAISNDDPSILNGPDSHSINGNSRDMWSILQAWEDLGLAGLGSLAMDSVRFALFEVPETIDEDTKQWNESVKKGINGVGVRAERLQEWRKEWDEFVEWVLEEYAAEWGGDEAV